MNRVELFATCQWQSLLESLEELLQVLLICILNQIKLNLKVVKKIGILLRQVLVVLTPEIF